ncbi:MAG TPA: nucleoside hydrolase [Thermoanaerobaculales bacterium]|nr:nucleoside hydrolase [Thermoanaerobaculales bacterium]HQL29820.1 nucleoside hydrolase [Thermoanaerobaculales bacterium]
MFSDRPIPRRSLVQATAAAALGLLIAPASASPDTQGPIRPVVIDTDMGVDDAVALALALQSPQISIVSIVACEGAAGRAAAVHNVERLLDAFNRQEIPVFASDLAGSAPPPDIRERAEAMIGAALPETSVWLRLPFAPEAYGSAVGPTTVLALGPLTQLAAALERRPGLASAIERVVVAGDPADRESWNLIRDPEAVRSVRRAGVRLQFVAARGRAAKPEAWHLRGLPESRSTSLADSFLDRLLAQPAAREHYLESLGQLHDELAVLYLLEPQLFEASRSGDVLMPREGVDVGARIAELMRRGRQLKQPVVLSDRSLPDVMLQEDLRARRDAIVAANGEDEWTAELLLNELHEHLGAYSIIGVKMGLRAAELLNAPRHAMAVVSNAPATQPESCLDDGLMCATGSTPGRGLLRREPGPPGTIQASFAYNRCRVTLRLKDDRRALIERRIGELLGQYSLADQGYWDGVRAFGLEIWQDWHRLDLFDVTIETIGALPAAPGAP